MKKLFLTAVMIVAMSVGAVVPSFAGVKVEAGARQVQAEDILVKESAPGALQKGKYIYLRCQYVSFEDGINYEVVSGDGKIDKVSSEDGIIKIHIKSQSSKEPMVIKLSNVNMYLNGGLPDGDYPLELVTEESEEYKDNAFGQNYDSDDSNFDTKYLVFDKAFFTVEGTSKNMENASDKKDDDLVLIIPEIAVDVSYGNKSGAYINESNYVMLPVRFVAEAFSDRAIVSWDDSTKTVTIIMGTRVISFTVGSKTMKINGNDVPLVSPMEIKDGRSFLSLRDLGYAMGVREGRIHWDNETKTAYLNYKGE